MAEARSPYREVTKVTIVIEPTGSEFRIESNDEENGWQTEDSVTEGLVWLIRQYAQRISSYGISHYGGVPSTPIIGRDGQTVGSITVERES